MRASIFRYWNIITIFVLTISGVWIWISSTPIGSSTEGGIPNPRKGFTAPDFSLQAVNGDVISLSELRGQPVIINLWASWCPPCRAEMPAIQNIYREYHDQGLEVVAINATNQDNPSEALAFVKANELTFPILMDIDGNVSRLYQLQALPTTFFVNSTGKIQDVVVGGPMAETLIRVRVNQLLEEASR